MDNKFVRYNSLENYWNLEKVMEKYAPDFDRTSVKSWIVTEKIHGSNVCISNRYKEGVAFFTRNGNQLPAQQQETLKKYDWEKLFKELKPWNIDFVYGEIAGPKVQKGVDYGDERKLYIFDYSDGEKYFDGLLFEVDGFDYAPVWFSLSASYDKILKLCLDTLEHNPVSKINPIEDNVIEGFVVKCVLPSMLTKETRFIFKVKHPKFNEKQKAKKRNKKFEDIDYSIVDQYINENRILSAMSKFPGYRKHQIGDVMREIVRDVEEDMKKDGHRWDKKFAKRVTSFAQKTVVMGAG